VLLTHREGALVVQVAKGGDLFDGWRLVRVHELVASVRVGRRHEFSVREWGGHNDGVTVCVKAIEDAVIRDDGVEMLQTLCGGRHY